MPTASALRLAALFLLVLPLFACVPKSVPREISRERAIEIARPHVTFPPNSVEAEKATVRGRPVWRVTFRGEPVSQVHLMGEVVVVEVDRETGEIVSLAMS